jgi:hypothetical protein
MAPVRSDDLVVERWYAEDEKPSLCRLFLINKKKKKKKPKFNKKYPLLGDGFLSPKIISPCGDSKQAFYGEYRWEWETDLDDFKIWQIF